MFSIPFIKKSKNQSKEQNLTGRYRRIAYVIITIFLVDIAIGYVNGGGKQTNYAAPKQVYNDTETGAQGSGAQIYSIEVLSNGATRTIFTLTNNNYDYLKKNINANIGKTKAKAKFINDRYFMVETPSKVQASSIKVNMTANNGTGIDKIATFSYSVNTKKANEKKFISINKDKFDQLYIDKEISESTKKIEKLKNTLKSSNNQIELDNTQILSLKSTLDGTVVQSDKVQINNQIDNLQQSLQQITDKVSETTKSINSESEHLKQLKEEKEKYEQ